MPDFFLDAQITATGTIDCHLTSTSQVSIQDPTLCFSLLAPGQVIHGARMVRELGGFCELALEADLSEDGSAKFEIAYEELRHRSGNRAWLPLNPYLKSANGEIHQVGWDNRGVIGPDLGPHIPEPDLLRLVPRPAQWSATGETAAFQGFHIKGPDAAVEAFQSVDHMAARNDFPAFLTETGTEVVALVNPNLASCGYQIHLTGTQVKIEASGTKGFFYGAVSLLTLMTNHAGSIPLGIIKDEPRFSWRGQHLDCARHYYQPDTIMRLLDLMALMKLNIFHWHFADDEAFRLEVDYRPEIWQKTAFRGENQTMPGVFGGGSGPTGGSYSAADVDAILARAAELQIDVLPEIEVPAHSLAIARVFPELRDPEDEGTERSVQGYPKNTLNPALPQTQEFLKCLADEVSHRFPFAHIHLGADELPTGCWQGSAHMDDYKARHGLSSENDALGFSLARLAEHLQKKGIRSCAWQEATGGDRGSIGHNAVLFSWTGEGPGKEAARKGYDVVMCPAQHLYFDMAHTDSTDDWGANWAAIVGLADTISWDPAPADDPEVSSRIVGVQAAYWSEFTTEDHQIEPMIAPRILGLSCLAWSPQNKVSEKHLFDLAKSYGPLFDAIKWNWNQSIVV